MDSALRLQGPYAYHSVYKRNTGWQLLAIKSPQTKILQRYFEAISQALEAGMKIAEIIQILKEKTGVSLDFNGATK